MASFLPVLCALPPWICGGEAEARSGVETPEVQRIGGSSAAQTILLIGRGGVVGDGPASCAEGH